MFSLFLPSPVLETSSLFNESGPFGAYPHLITRGFQYLDVASTNQPVSLGTFDDCSMDLGSDLKSLSLSSIAFDTVHSDLDNWRIFTNDCGCCRSLPRRKSGQFPYLSWTKAISQVGVITVSLPNGRTLLTERPKNSLAWPLPSPLL